MAAKIQRATCETRCDAFVIGGPGALGDWSPLGDVIVLTPGIALAQVRMDPGCPLVIDERCLDAGAWADLAGSTGEGLLQQLTEVRRTVRESGGVVVGVPGSPVPDVNLAAVRELYDLTVDTGRGTAGKEPELVRKIRRVREGGGQWVS